MGEQFSKCLKNDNPRKMKKSAIVSGASEDYIKYRESDISRSQMLGGKHIDIKNRQ